MRVYPVCLHFLAPTLISKIQFAEDKPWYFVLFFTVVVYLGYVRVLLETPHDIVSHLVFNFLHLMMHFTWQMTTRTDP